MANSLGFMLQLKPNFKFYVVESGKPLLLLFLKNLSIRSLLFNHKEKWKNQQQNTWLMKIFHFKKCL
uniref:Uncharacterized protein n=1 Tax=Mycoplasmopsis fermentans TaxID=2115 RepID=Q9KX56_MYCFE|nr:unknown [Mycoplasmopsis fermentans]